MNGFGETGLRVGNFTIYRPSVVQAKATATADRFNWKMKGVNSIMYDVVDHVKLGRTHRKITIQLN